MTVVIPEGEATDRQLLRAVLTEVREMRIQMAELEAAVDRVEASVAFELTQIAGPLLAQIEDLQSQLAELQVESADDKAAAIELAASIANGVARLNAFADQLDANDPVVDPEPEEPVVP